MLVDLGRTTSAASAVDRSVEVSDVMTHRTLQPRDAHHVECLRPAWPPEKGRSRPCRPACRRNRFRRAGRCGRWRSSTSWNRIVAGHTPGPVGYVDFSGNMDTCIALRTLVVQGDKGYCGRPAPGNRGRQRSRQRVWQETMNKARGLLKAIELAQRGKS